MAEFASNTLPATQEMPIRHMTTGDAGSNDGAVYGLNVRPNPHMGLGQSEAATVVLTNH